MTENRDYTHVITANWEKSMNVLNRLFEIAKPSAAFGEPIQKGEYTVITASETAMGLGLGTGAGSGTEELSADAANENAAPESGSGGGGGGGWSRPVAVISIGPKGVEVEPVVDVTKLGLAFFTMIGSAMFMLSKMKRGTIYD
jgi:uncharacterized spore protein YtfJ